MKIYIKLGFGIASLDELPNNGGYGMRKGDVVEIKTESLNFNLDNERLNKLKNPKDVLEYIIRSAGNNAIRYTRYFKKDGLNNPDSNGVLYYSYLCKLQYQMMFNDWFCDNITKGNHHEYSFEMLEPSYITKEALRTEKESYFDVLNYNIGSESHPVYASTKTLVNLSFKELDSDFNFDVDNRLLRSFELGEMVHLTARDNKSRGEFYRLVYKNNTVYFLMIQLQRSISSCSTMCLNNVDELMDIDEVQYLKGLYKNIIKLSNSRVLIVSSLMNRKEYFFTDYTTDGIDATIVDNILNVNSQNTIFSSIITLKDRHK